MQINEMMVGINRWAVIIDDQDRKVKVAPQESAKSVRRRRKKREIVL